LEGDAMRQQPRPVAEPEYEVRSVGLRRNVRWGIGWGLGFAAALSAFVGLMAVLRGSTSYEEVSGLSTWHVLAYYFGAGLAGGVLVGLLRPYQHHYWGKYLTAYLALLLVYGGGTAVFLPMLTADAPGPSLTTMLLGWAVVCVFLAPVYVRVFRD
jgi:hypothetical protein